MKKQLLKEICEEKKVDFDKVLKIVRESIKNVRTNWAAFNEIIFDESDNFAWCPYFTRCGYRKNTTGEYVSNAYRNNFGWKNTFYQAAHLRIVINPSKI